MDHWVEAADWIIWQLTGRYVRNACTAGYKGILQDGQYPSRDFLAALNPDFAGFADDKVAHEIGRLGDAAGTLSAQAAAVDRPARGHRGRCRQRGCARHCPRRPGGRARPDGRDHGNIHLPRDERRRPDRGSRHVRRGRRRHRLGPLRLRGRPVGRRRHLRLVRREPGSGRVHRGCARGRGEHPPVPHVAHRGPAGRRPRTRRPRLAVGQPLRARRPRTVGSRPRHHTLHPAGGGLPCPSRGDRVRNAHDRRDLRQRAACP